MTFTPYVYWRAFNRARNAALATMRTDPHKWVRHHRTALLIHRRARRAGVVL